MNVNLITLFKKVFLLVCLMGIAGTSYTAQMNREDNLQEVLNWERIVKVYDAYIESTSLGNAYNVIEILPRDRLRESQGDAESSLIHMFSSDFYPVLQGEAISGVREAIEIHFRLLNITDGIYSEIVSSTLGQIVRNYPRLFLEVLQHYQNTNRIRTRGYPVDFVGMGLNMHAKAALHVLKERMKALETVKHASLLNLSKACIIQLRRAIKQRPSSVSASWDDE